MTTIVPNPLQVFKLVRVSELQEDLKKAITTPDFQRSINMARVDEMYNDMVRSFEEKKEIILTGTITICETRDKKEMWLADGQHRLSALARLFKEKAHDQPIMCNTIRVANQEEAKKIFDLVNKSTPVPHMPPGVKMSHANIVIKAITKRSPAIWSESTRCQRPQIYQTGFAEAIAAFLRDRTASEVIRKLEEYDLRLAEANWTEFKCPGDNQNRIENMKAKARQKGTVYLGMHKGFDYLNKIFSTR